ncbi:MAG: hypothetical protein AB7K68_15315 [Bacteriovoracia bacterium]
MNIVALPCTSTFSLARGDIGKFSKPAGSESTNVIVEMGDIFKLVRGATCVEEIARVYPLQGPQQNLFASGFAC